MFAKEPNKWFLSNNLPLNRWKLLFTFCYPIFIYPELISALFRVVNRITIMQFPLPLSHTILHSVSIYLLYHLHINLPTHSFLHNNRIRQTDNWKWGASQVGLSLIQWIYRVSRESFLFSFMNFIRVRISRFTLDSAESPHLAIHKRMMEVPGIRHCLIFVGVPQFGIAVNVISGVLFQPRIEFQIT